MNITYLNAIPQMIATNKLTKDQAVKKMALYVQENFSVFNIINCDEDLKSDIVLHVLDKGKVLFDKYTKENGDFFNYFYSYVRNTEITCRRKNLRSTIQEIHNVNERIMEIKDNADSYTISSYPDPEQVRVPYRPERINIEAFQTACKSNKYSLKKYVDKHQTDLQMKEKIAQMSPIKLRKTVLILALKSAYYLNDNQINHISNLCNISKPLLEEAIQILKSQLLEREKNKIKLEERRNNAYFQHKRYLNELRWLNEEKDEYNKYKVERVIQKYEKQTECWKMLNSKLQSGVTNIRPTNKAIADILGICERQVSYYIKHAKDLEKETQDNQENNTEN